MGRGRPERGVVMDGYLVLHAPLYGLIRAGPFSSGYVASSV